MNRSPGEALLLLVHVHGDLSLEIDRPLLYHGLQRPRHLPLLGPVGVSLGEEQEGVAAQRRLHDDVGRLRVLAHHGVQLGLGAVHGRRGILKLVGVDDLGAVFAHFLLREVFCRSFDLGSFKKMFIVLPLFALLCEIRSDGQ